MDVSHREHRQFGYGVVGMREAVIVLLGRDVVGQGRVGDSGRGERVDRGRRVALTPEISGG